MSYQHDIFISYRRSPETYRWITKHFLPLLSFRVGLELDREPSIYLDDQIETGASWPLTLGAALGRSRILIALWSGNYLASTWCTEELSHMLGREHQAKLRTVERPRGIVVPIFIHDGDKFPPELRHIEYFEVQKCFNVRMATGSELAEELDRILAAQAPAISACILNAPDWRSQWPKQASDTFFERFFQAHAPQQTAVPRFTNP